MEAEMLPMMGKERGTRSWAMAGLSVQPASQPDDARAQERWNDLPPSSMALCTRWPITPLLE